MKYTGTKKDLITKLLPHNLYIAGQILPFDCYFTAKEFADKQVGLIYKIKGVELTYKIVCI